MRTARGGDKPALLEEQRRGGLAGAEGVRGIGSQAGSHRCQITGTLQAFGGVWFLVETAGSPWGLGQDGVY